MGQSASAERQVANFHAAPLLPADPEAADQRALHDEHQEEEERRTRERDAQRERDIDEMLRSGARGGAAFASRRRMDNAALLTPSSLFTPYALSQRPSLSEVPFPLLTSAQLCALRDAGVDLDLCFQPHLMPRLPHSGWGEQHPGSASGREQDPFFRSLSVIFGGRNGPNAHSPLRSRPSIDPSSASSSLAQPPRAKRIVYLDSSLHVKRQSVMLTAERRLFFIVDASVAARCDVYLDAKEHIEIGASKPSVVCHSRTGSLSRQLHAGNDQLLEFDLNQLADPSVFILQPPSDAAASLPSFSTPLSTSSSDPSQVPVNLFRGSRNHWPLVIHLQVSDDTTVTKTSALNSPSSSWRDERNASSEEINPKRIDHLILYCVFTRLSAASSSALPRHAQAEASALSAVAPSALPESSDQNDVSERIGSTFLGISIVKRQVRCGQHRFEVAEVYGLPREDAQNPFPSSIAAAAAGTERESGECVICLTNRRTHAIYPCRHLCLCESCAQQLAHQETNRCPICRRAVTTTIPILASSPASIARVASDVALHSTSLHA